MIKKKLVNKKIENILGKNLRSKKYSKKLEKKEGNSTFDCK